jgi:hypothetical protein
VSWITDGWDILKWDIDKHQVKPMAIVTKVKVVMVL